jgi:hypothetical protein
VAYFIFHEDLTATRGGALSGPGAGQKVEPADFFERGGTPTLAAAGWRKLSSVQLCDPKKLFNAESKADQRRRSSDPSKHGSVTSEARSVEREFA